MSTSTELMLQKLRNGDYFCAREWLSGFAASSQDELLPRAIYELITHDFQPGDADYIHMLNAIDKTAEIFFIPGEYLHANMTLYTAALQCLVYLDQDLRAFYQNRPEHISITAWMHRDNEQLDNDRIKEKIGIKIAEFEELTASCHAKLVALQDSILKTNRFKTNCNDYHRRLYSSNTHNPEAESCQAARLGVLAALCDKLASHIMFTDSCQSDLKNYVAQIRQLQPDFWEEAYLRKLQPTPTTWLQDISFFTKSQLVKMLAIPGGLPTSRSDPGLASRSYDA